MEGSIKDNLQNAFKEELKNIYNNKNFRKRTFKSKYYGNIVSDDIIFFAFDSCINCQHDIDLESISMNFKEMDRELTWTKCPQCGSSILPKITVQFGKEINKNGKMKQNSCKLDNVVLFSPFFLKDNYNSVALRAVGVNLDVEDLDICIGDDDDNKLENQNQNVKDDKTINKFDLNALKTDKIELILKA